VSTSAGALAANDTGSPAGIAIHNDLGSGTVFGSVTPATVNDNPIVVSFNAAGTAALNAARGGTFSVGGAVTDDSFDNYLFGGSQGQTVTLTLTTEDATLQPDAQIRGGLASYYLGNDIYNQDGLGQTFGRKAKPGFGDQFNVKIENDGTCSDTFLVQGAGNYNKYKVTYWSGPLNVTPSVVGGTFQTSPLDPGASELLRVFIYAVRGVKIGTMMTDLISFSSNEDPSVTDVVGATLGASRTAGDFNSSRPIP